VALARERGFVAAGILAAETATTHGTFLSWLGSGYHGEMKFLERDAAARARFDEVLPYTRSILAVAREVTGAGPGNVAKYARGEDYHVVVRRELKAVAESFAPLAPPGTHFRVAVDTAPVLEREVAVRAGLGFIGKNGLLIVPGIGSHVVLGELLTDLVLAPTAPPLAESALIAAAPAPRAHRLPDRCLARRGRRGAALAASPSRSGALFPARNRPSPASSSAATSPDVCPWNRVRHPEDAPSDAGANLTRKSSPPSTRRRLRRFGRTALFRACGGPARNAEVAPPDAARS
jgi:epoxyqueuosine reductase